MAGQAITFGPHQQVLVFAGLGDKDRTLEAAQVMITLNTAALSGIAAESPGHQKSVDELVKKYPQALELRKADGFHEQIWVSMNLCRDFAQNIDGFFERVIKASGLPNRHMQIDI